MDQARVVRRTAVASLVAVLVLLGPRAVGSMRSSSAGRASNAPVVFVHGFLLNVCPQTDAKSVFASAISTLKARGHTGVMDPIAYYACDSGGSDIESSGDPGAYYPSGANHGLSGVRGGNTDRTDLRHISYQLAWYIYDTYSSKGKTVELVAHSMGGLITSWMLYQEQIKNPLFPPRLLVQDSVTISTPYDGVNDGYDNVTWCPSSQLQCTQLLPGSDVLRELHARGLNGQASGGTVWTALGGSPCDSVDNPKGTTLDAGNVDKVSFYATTPAAPVCYSHTGYLTDASTARDMPLRFHRPGDARSTSIATGRHALAWMADAVMGVHP